MQKYSPPGASSRRLQQITEAHSDENVRRCSKCIAQYRRGLGVSSAGYSWELIYLVTLITPSCGTVWKCKLNVREQNTNETEYEKSKRTPWQQSLCGDDVSANVSMDETI